MRKSAILIYIHRIRIISNKLTSVENFHESNWEAGVMRATTSTAAALLALATMSAGWGIHHRPSPRFHVPPPQQMGPPPQGPWIP